MLFFGGTCVTYPTFSLVMLFFDKTLGLVLTKKRASGPEGLRRLNWCVCIYIYRVRSGNGLWSNRYDFICKVFFVSPCWTLMVGSDHTWGIYARFQFWMIGYFMQVLSLEVLPVRRRWCYDFVSFYSVMYAEHVGVFECEKLRQNHPTQVPQVLPVFPWDNGHWTGLGSSSGGLTLWGGKMVAG